MAIYAVYLQGDSNSIAEFLLTLKHNPKSFVEIIVIG